VSEQFQTWEEIPVTVHASDKGIEGVEIADDMAEWVLDRYKGQFLKEWRENKD
jgi:hypothetical protein